MSKIKVYLCTRHNLDLPGDVPLPRWRTREAFERDKADIMGLKLHEKTELEIDASLVDFDGLTAFDFDPSKHQQRAISS